MGELQGEFEHHVLLAVMRLGSRAFTSSIVLELEERTGREVMAASVYVALKRLETKGLVRSEMRRDATSGQLRERRFVQPTEDGLDALRVARDRFVSLWDGFEARLSPGDR